MIRLNEDKIQLSGQGDTKFIKLKSGQPEEDDFNDLVSVMDQLFDMLLSTKYRSMFDTSIRMNKIRDVKRRFDEIISDICEKQEKDQR